MQGPGIGVRVCRAAGLRCMASGARAGVRVGPVGRLAFPWSELELPGFVGSSLGGRSVKTMGKGSMGKGSVPFLVLLSGLAGCNGRGEGSVPSAEAKGLEALPLKRLSEGPPFSSGPILSC